VSFRLERSGKPESRVMSHYLCGKGIQSFTGSSPIGFLVETSWLAVRRPDAGGRLKCIYALRLMVHSADQILPSFVIWDEL
jgi:hypothetical protein